MERMKRSEEKQSEAKRREKGRGREMSLFILIFFLNLFIVFGCTGSSLLCTGFL